MKWDPGILIVRYTAVYTSVPLLNCLLLHFCVYRKKGKKPAKWSKSYIRLTDFYSILFYSFPSPSVLSDKWSGQSGYANWCLLLCFLPLFSKVQLHSSTAIHHWNEAGCGAKLNVPISISQRQAVQGTEVTGGNWLVEGDSKIGVVVGGRLAEWRGVWEAEQLWTLHCSVYS